MNLGTPWCSRKFDLRWKVAYVHTEITDDPMYSGANLAKQSL